MTRTEIKSINKKIENHQQAVAKERDRLDAFIDELEGLKHSCDQAWDALQDARDALSELV